MASHSPLALVPVLGASLGAYHGYKRNGSVAWALWWAFAGAAVPVVTLPVAVAQGFGEPAPDRFMLPAPAR